MWISCYIYYKEPADVFLAKGIKPLVELLKKKNLIKNFFFIRYWTNGPHIRLRLKTDSYNIRHVRRELVDYFTGYFQTDHILFTGSLAQGKLYPSGIIRFVSYRPEINRYGGKWGVEIAERQFELSSMIVLDLLSDSGSRDRDSKLGIALSMTYLLYLAVLGNVKAVRQYLLKEFDFPASYQKKFEPHFSKQKDALVNYFSLLLNEDRFQAGASVWMVNWRWGMGDIGGILRKLRQKKEFNSGTYGEILKSYVHMNNNRLGIDLSEEPYLIYLLRKIFAELKNI
jgi:thiopeptide-type bacteriocin biosynthesis protein